MKYHYLILFPLIFLGLGHESSDANIADAPQCVKKLDHDLDTGQWLKLVTLDSQTIEGSLVAVTYRISSIIIDIKSDSLSLQKSISFGNIAQISYYKKGKYKLLFILAGLTAGGYVGTLIGGSEGKDDDAYTGIGKLFAGMFFGAAIGTAAGIILSNQCNHLVTITCKF